MCILSSGGGKRPWYGKPVLLTRTCPLKNSTKSSPRNKSSPKTRPLQKVGWVNRAFLFDVSFVPTKWENFKNSNTLGSSMGSMKPTKEALHSQGTANG